MPCKSGNYASACLFSEAAILEHGLLLPYVQDLRLSRLRRMQHEDTEAMQSWEADEDVEREIWLKQLALASLRAAEKLSGIQQVCLILVALYCQSTLSALESSPH